MSLRGRIAAVAAVAVALAVILVSAGAYLAARSELRAEVDEALLERATLVSNAFDEFEQLVAQDRLRWLPPGLLAGARQNFDVVYYQLTLPSGRRLVARDQPALPPVSSDAVGDEPILTDEVVGGVHVRVAAVDASPFGVVQIARPLTEVDATLSGLATILLTVGFVGTAAAALIGLLVARSALKPIDDLTEAARRVAQTQDLAQRIDVDSDDEVGSLAASFNAMLAALEESRAQQRRLVRDAGHELRTPLTALRTNIELLARSEDLSGELRAELLDAARAEVIDLSSLVTEIVDLASDRYAESQSRPVSLDQVADAAVAKARRRTGSEIELIAEPTTVMGDQKGLERAIDNLLDNALKWNGDGGPIEVVVGDGRVAVRDHGPGIPPHEAELVFDRFYRSPAARATPGSGLGLSIVKQVVDGRGGKVFVEAPEGGGAIVGFALPTAISGDS